MLTVASTTARLVSRLADLLAKAIDSINASPLRHARAAMQPDVRRAINNTLGATI